MLWSRCVLRHLFLLPSTLPQLTSCLAEQFFTSNYSIPQRLAMMHALASAAHELAGLAPLTDVDAHAMRVADQAVQRAPEKGTSQIRPWDVPFAPAKTIAPKANYLSVATSAFVLPLVNRFFLYLGPYTRGGYRHAGSNAALRPEALSAALLTLCILCSAARNALGFYANVMPDVITLAVLCCGRAQENDAQVHGASLSLVLVMLDAAWERDRGAQLVRTQASLLLNVRDTAQGILDSDVPAGDASPRARAVRAAAGTLVRVSEMERDARDALLGPGTL